MNKSRQDSPDSSLTAADIFVRREPDEDEDEEEDEDRKKDEDDEEEDDGTGYSE
jgi:hypothetical protein